MKKSFIHNAAFRWIAPLGYGVFVYLLILLINNNLQQLREIFIGQEVYICVTLTYANLEISRQLLMWLNRVLPERWLPLRAPLQILLTVLATLAITGGGLILYFNQVIGFSISAQQLTLFLVLYGITTLLYNLLYLSNEYLHRENTLRLTSERQQREVLELEMMEFRNDINPELLYEGLEGIISLMYRNREQAEEHIDCLAFAYRYSLTHRQRELIPVAEELEAAHNLIQLLNEKYDGLIHLTLSEELNMRDRHLIPGSLPITIEAIVRNTIVSKHEPLTLSCFTDDGEYLTVQSKLNDRLTPHPESLRALQRLQKSYALYSSMPLIQVKAYEENYIKLPLLRVTEELSATPS